MTSIIRFQLKKEIQKLTLSLPDRRGGGAEPKPRGAEVELEQQNIVRIHGLLELGSGRVRG